MLGNPEINVINASVKNSIEHVQAWKALPALLYLLNLNLPPRLGAVNLFFLTIYCRCFPQILVSIAGSFVSWVSPNSLTMSWLRSHVLKFVLSSISCLIEEPIR